MPSLKTVLINPTVPGASTFPSGEFFECTAPNMGLAYIAAYLEKYGKLVDIIDANAWHMGEEELFQKLQEAQPDIVGVTATTTTLMDGFAAIKVAKRACPDAILTMGGIHVSRFPKETLQECPELDFVSVGEGEITFLEAVELFESGSRDMSDIKGVAFRKDGQIVLTEPRPDMLDLDSLPLPARHLLPMEQYGSGGHPHRTASIVSSRGCPFCCKFCAAPFIGGKRWRARSAQSLLEEVDEIVNVYHMNSFEFVDDLFTLDKKRVMEFCQGVKERGYEITWTCSARADTVTPELLRAMAGAGCRIVNYGIESGSERILEMVGKRETREQMLQAVRWTKEASMRSWGFFIIGFPSETPEEIERTISFATELELDYAEFFICSAFPGSPLYEYAIEQSLVQKKTWADISYGKANIQNEYLTPEELELYMIKGYRDFYTNPRVMRRMRLFGQEEMYNEIVRQTSEAFGEEAQEKAEVSGLVSGYPSTRDNLLAVLQAVQAQQGYLSEDAMGIIARHFGLNVVDVRGVASFYNQFKFNKPGKHSVKVCTGTACHVKGAQLVLDEWERQLGCKCGHTTEDGEYDLEKVACVGCCSIAPVVLVDDATVAEMRAADVKEAIKKIEAADEAGLPASQAGLDSLGTGASAASVGLGGSGFTFGNLPNQR